MFNIIKLPMNSNVNKQSVIITMKKLKYAKMPFGDNFCDKFNKQPHGQFKIMLSQSENWWCTEYADEIHEVLRGRQGDRFHFDFKSPQLKWRPHIIHYMLSTARKHELAKTTFHLAVYYLDIFMDNHIIRMWRLYLVALTSLRIAAKVEEKEFTPAKVGRLNASGNYTREDYNILESIMLKLFDWDMNIPAVATFGSYYAEFVADETDFNNNNTNNQHRTYDSFADFKNDIKSDVMLFIDMSIFDVSLQHNISPSKLAAMCLAATRFKWNIEPIWTECLAKITRFSWENIEFDFGKLFDITSTMLPRKQLEIELDQSIIEESKHELD